MSVSSPRLSSEVALQLIQVSKRYPGVLALDRVDLELKPGEIHAVVGENGAGKSTLIKIITGVIECDEGEIRVKGVSTSIGTPQNAAHQGITAVPQDVLLVPDLPIGRNILLGSEKLAIRRDWLGSREQRIVQDALAQVGANFGPNTPTRSLSVPQLRLAQIARALIRTGDILVLDEPTAVLSEPDAEHLLSRLMDFRKSGKAIVYITHRLSEVMTIADRVTVLRDGRCVGRFARGAFDRAQLVRLMAKQDSSIPVQTRGETGVSVANAEAAPALVVSGLSSGRRFKDIRFTVRRGEIVGLAGVQGSGHGHVLRAIAGVDPVDVGTVSLFGKEIARGSPDAAFQAGLQLVPADRRGAGIVASRSIQENIALSPNVPKMCKYFGFRLLAGERSLAVSQIERLSINPPSPEAFAGGLSGGNQQKVVLARALSGDVQVLLTEEPTQGIDIGSRTEIHALLRHIAREQGRAVLIATSEFEELIGLADVIHVMRLGRLVATLPGAGARYHDILHEALP